MNTETLDALLGAVPFPAFVAAMPSGRVVWWNRAAAQQCDAELLASTTVQALLQPVDEPQVVDSIDRAIKDGATVTDVDAVLRAGSTWLPVAVSVAPVGDRGADSGQALVVCYPTARWADVRAGAHRVEERLAIALAAARLGSWEYDLRTRQLTSTAQCKINHGFAPDEEMQLDPHIIATIDADHRPAFLQAIEHAIETHGTLEIEVPNRWPDGTDHWLLVAGRVVDATSIVGVSQDITERRRIEQALRDSEQQYRAIVEIANEGIWQLNQDAIIIFVNDRMAEMLAVAPDEMLGRHKWDFVFEADVAAMKGLFERRKQGVSEEVADIRFRRADGNEIWTMMAARPLYDAAGRFTGAVDLFMDITERRRAEEALRESDRRKDEFLAVLSHELRGPLAPILMAVQLLQAKGPPDPLLQRLRDTIYRQTRQLSTLVEDLLDVGRITAGKLRLDKKRIDLRDVAKQAVEVSAALIERRRHTLHIDVPDHPVHVDADAARLVQVAGNLINNAAKYTPEGGRIEVRVFADSGMGVLSVCDHGVGIPPEMLDRIFDRFVQVHTGSTAARSEGLGIGLSVVKALVELHGGKVVARSAGIGHGSEFTFRVPLALNVPLAVGIDGRSLSQLAE